MRTTLTWSERFGTHDMGDWAIYVPPVGLVEPDTHVDNPRRTARFRRLIVKTGLEERLDVVAPRRGDRRRARGRTQPRARGRDGARGRGRLGRRRRRLHADERRVLRPRAVERGLGPDRVERVLDGRADRAWAIGRRSGHHASRDTGYGFCIFNNVAVAAAAAQRAGGVKRIAIVDIDAHHGNGTEAIFYDDPSVLTISLHEDRMFPLETGGADARGGPGAEGANLNVPLWPGTGDAGYLYAIDEIVVPALDAFAPDLLLVCAGVDGSMYDPLSTWGLTAGGFADVARRLVAVAERHCGGRAVFEQEGGYSPVYAPFCWLKLLEVLADAPLSEDPFGPFLAGAGFTFLADHQRDARRRPGRPPPVEHALA